MCCKLLEHIICQHMMSHLESHKILTSLQHGFRSGHSCETQLVTTMDGLLKNADNSTQTDMLILDFSKAFDTDPHSRLLLKLESYGIKGTTLRWIKSFLSNRHQQVVIDSETSGPAPVMSGVPQGTVLGPILFLCCINDIPDRFKSTIRLFADDCLLYRQIKSLADQIQLQQDLASLEAWAQDWGMKFNPIKCYLMSITSSKRPFTYRYTLDNHTLQQVQNSSYLGVLLSDDMKWTPHITKITKKASSTLGFLSRNLRHCSGKL